MTFPSTLDASLECELIQGWQTTPGFDALAAALLDGLAWPMEESSSGAARRKGIWTPNPNLPRLVAEANGQRLDIRGKLGRLSIMIDENAFTLRCSGIKLSVLKQEGFDLRDRMERCVLAMERSGCVRWFGPDLAVGPNRYAYARPRPPIHHPGFAAGALWMGSDRRFHQRAEHERWSPSLERFDALRTRELPPGARRTEVRDLVFVDFGANVQDPDSIANTASRQEVWLGSLGCRRDSQFNAAGDKLSAVGAATADPDLTFYERSPERENLQEYPDRAYKAVVAGTDGQLPPALLEHYRGILETQRTPSGLEVGALVFIAPNRDTAVTCLEQARAIGVQTVLYTSNQSTDGSMLDNGAIVFYDPSPAGDWLN